MFFMISNRFSLIHDPIIVKETIMTLVSSLGLYIIGNNSWLLPHLASRLAFPLYAILTYIQILCLQTLHNSSQIWDLRVFNLIISHNPKSCITLGHHSLLLQGKPWQQLNANYICDFQILGFFRAMCIDNIHTQFKILDESCTKKTNVSS